MKYLVNYKAYGSETYVLLDASSDNLFKALLIEHLLYVPYHDLRILGESGKWKTVKEIGNGT